MESNQSNDNHAHTMRNILIPIIVVVALIIVSIFFSENSAFSSLKSEQGAAVGSAISQKVLPGGIDPSIAAWYPCGGDSQSAIALCREVCYAAGGEMDFDPGDSNGTELGCLTSSVVPGNLNPTFPPVFKGKITAKHYSALQSYLSSKGFLEQGYNTAKRDSKTRTALKAYQKSIGITASGSLSSATKAKLNMEMSQLFKPATKAMDNSQTTDLGSPTNPISVASFHDFGDGDCAVDGVGWGTTVSVTGLPGFYDIAAVGCLVNGEVVLNIGQFPGNTTNLPLETTLKSGQKAPVKYIKLVSGLTTKAVNNSQTTDQDQIEKIITEAIKTKTPVDPNSPFLSTGAVCERAYSLCVGGCHLSGAASDSTSDCLLTCAQAWLSCHKGFNYK